MEEQIPGERRYLMTGTVDEKVEWGLKAEKWNCNYFLSRSTYPSLSYLVPREERQEPCPNIAVSRREREREREVSSISQDKNDFNNEVSGLKGK